MGFQLGHLIDFIVQFRAFSLTQRVSAPSSFLQFCNSGLVVSTVVSTSLMVKRWWLVVGTTRSFSREGKQADQLAVTILGSHHLVGLKIMNVEAGATSYSAQVPRKFAVAGKSAGD